MKARTGGGKCPQRLRHDEPGLALQQRIKSGHAPGRMSIGLAFRGLHSAAPTQEGAESENRDEG